MSKFLFHCATPARSLAVCLSSDETTVSVAMVGSPIEIEPGKVLPPGYWEFTGERAEELIAELATWDTVSIIALVYCWEYSGEAVFAEPHLVDCLPDVPEDTIDTQSGPVAVHPSPQQSLRGAL